MMFRVFVVDDEPIILSGISHLLDWQRLDCQIAGCYRNGKEAYDAICSSGADIVITDIKMPVMDGLELIRKCQQTHPAVVFVILTSLEEFRLVKEAIRYSVSEYLVKTELNEKLLAQVIEKVKLESLRRKDIYEPSNPDEGTQSSLDRIVSSFMLMREADAQIKLRLSAKGLLDSCGFINFLFDYPQNNDDASWKPNDYNRLYEWQKDVIEKVLPAVFPDAVPVTPPAARYCSLVYFIHGVDGPVYKALVNRLDERVRKASSLVTGLKPVLVYSSLYDGPDGLMAARDEMEKLATGYYLEKDDFTLSPLALDGIYVNIESALREKNTAALDTAFRLIGSTLEKKDHMLSQADFILSALASAISAGLSHIGVPDDGTIEEFFSLVPYISRRRMIVRMIEELRNEVTDIIGGISSGSSSQISDKAREYVITHIEQRITLTDAASFAGVSPGYLSKTFKKTMGQSFVDYVNTMKTERAIEMMRLGRSRINEIALSLGFENIYYFSKVFKKVTGMNPTSYLRKQEENDEA